MINAGSIIFSPKTHRVLYVLLLIATPFLLLQNYLQSAIGQLSDTTYTLFDKEIPLTVTVALILIVTIIIVNIKKININRIIAWIIIIFLLWIGQKSTDYYFNHKYYELQYNWHYFAYSIFAYLNYKALKQNNISDARIIIHTFIIVLLISTFDEAIQIPLSSRIFDIGDISKDLWGAMIGLFFIFFILKNGNINSHNNKIREHKIKNYLTNPLSVLVFGFIISFIFLNTSSLLTETKYTFSAIFISLFLSVLVFLIIHFSQFKISRVIIITIIAIGFCLLIFKVTTHRDKQIEYINNQTILYKGIPVFYFDVMIFPDGWARLVDKKTSFNQRDKQTIFSHVNDILIIGSGDNGKGGKGFTQNSIAQFVYNTSLKKGQQVIIMKNKEAIKKYNQLVEEGKNPMLIYHNN